MRKYKHEPNKFLIEKGWHYHGANLYSFEGCEAMTAREALRLQKSCETPPPQTTEGE